MEIWKDSYVNGYEVSNIGNVRHKKNAKNRVFRLDNKGYYRFNIRVNKKYLTYPVHKLVAEAFVENPNGFNVINHIDSNPKNNKAENLEWCTQLHNVEHSYKFGKRGFGEKSGNVKLTNEAIFDIRENCNKRGLPKIFAEKYNVTKSAIYHVMHGTHWNHI